MQVFKLIFKRCPWITKIFESKIFAARQKSLKIFTLMIVYIL